MFSTKSEDKKVEQVLPRSRGRGEGEVAQIMYIHISKCKNDKVKFLKNKIKRGVI
jgi:hypothetical protein